MIDVTAEVAANDDYLLDVAALEAMGSARTAGFPRRLGAAADADGADDRARVPQRARRRPARPGFDQATSLLLATDRDVLGVGVETIGTDAGQAGRSIRRFRITTSCTATASSAWRASAISIDCRHRRRRDRRAAEDRQRQRQPAPRHRTRTRT